MSSSIDYGHDIPEIYAKNKGLYFQSLPGIHLFFMDLTTIGSIVYSWQEQTGGKGAVETLFCLWLALTEFCTGAGKITLSLDTAGQLLCQHLIFFCHYITSRFSPVQL